MLFGMVALSVIFGLLAVTVGTALAVPGWALLLIYPVAGALMLLTSAFLVAIRDSRAEKQATQGAFSAVTTRAN